MEWFELQLEVPDALKDSIINRLFELGAEGLSESEGVNHTTLKGYFEDKLKENVEVEMEVYLTSMAQMFPLLPKMSMRFSSVRRENWAERYKEFYHAQKLTQLFFLKPAWEGNAAVPEGMIPLIMEPGQAFGTGLHASTRLSLKLMQHAVENFPDLARMRFIDVGTGSGILAIAAYKLGVRQITAVDTDPVAVQTANENFGLNGCKGMRAKTQGFASFQGPFDLIVSNILLETHRELAPAYQKLIAPGGQLILSGLLTPQRAELTEILSAYGFVEESGEYLQEWMAVLLRRGNS